MANLRDIRDRIASVKSTQQITKAMKMVAAARLRKAQERMMATRPYVSGLEDVLGKLGEGDAENRYLKPVDKPEKVLMVIVGSDRGLCGGFNSNLFRFLTDEIERSFPGYKKSGNLSLVTVGRKAGDYFGKRGYNVIEKNNGFFDDLNFEDTSAIMKRVSIAFGSGEYDAVYLGFNEFKSVITQNRIMKQVLPVQLEQDEDETESKAPADYIFEPEPEEILRRLIPLHINMQLWRAVLDSNAAEQGARMAAMDNATENAKEIIRVLNLQYNQARQAAITTELSEIVSGAEALNG